MTAAEFAPTTPLLPTDDMYGGTTTPTVYADGAQ